MARRALDVARASVASVRQVTADPRPAIGRPASMSQSVWKARFAARRHGSPRRMWTMRVISVATAVVVLIGFSWIVKTVNSHFPTFPRPASQGVVGASIVGSEPTAWAFALAARQSPESLDALLDRQHRQNAANAPRSGRLVAPPTKGPRNTAP